ncbi:hypothetical protein KIN20_007650 [Parelaphostrongylus tenuis]|uniref:Uncharacterized protein n=1 Tax=Parelaphostrongylus tenuis TaxID=148309 RepID=A0AAD5MPX9_PARTN|nr:hypothetical protein KIN20_007650 [Parelaphostrongylus tenuis]
MESTPFPLEIESASNARPIIHAMAFRFFIKAVMAFTIKGKRFFSMSSISFWQEVKCEENDNVELITSGIHAFGYSKQESLKSEGRLLNGH